MMVPIMAIVGIKGLIAL